MKYLIVGSGTAGTRAALEIRKQDRKAEVTLVSESTYPEFSPCALPFVLKQIIPGFEKTIIHPIDFYKKLAKIDLHLGEKALKIKDCSLETEKGELEFDKLLIATGFKPFVPPIPGTGLKNVSTLVNIDDGKKIESAMKTAKNAVVIGSGMIGIETAAALSSAGTTTTVIELLPQVFPILDKEISDTIQKYLEAEGINIALGEKVTEIVGKAKVEAVQTEKKTLPADLVVIATGVKPNIGLAKEAGIEIGEAGGIKTDKFLQTSKQNIYAAGNCTEVEEFFSGKPILSNLGTTAERQGLIAGLNMAGSGGAGSGPIEFKPVLNSSVARLHELEVGAVGLSTYYAGKLGIQTKSAKFTGKHLPEYYPGGKDITVKLISDESGTIVGAQLAGAGVLSRVEAMTFGMQKGLTAEELAFAEMPYTPPMCPAVDPIRITASMLMRKK